jgi:hypothetical protein
VGGDYYTKICQIKTGIKMLMLTMKMSNPNEEGIKRPEIGTNAREREELRN